MALRAFRSNPSLGGFGGESSGGRAPPATAVGAPPSNSAGGKVSRTVAAADGRRGGGFRDHRSRRTVAQGDGDDGEGERRGGGDAFAQIVKELVDNAVDACSSGGGAAAAGTDEQARAVALKRVRVVIQSVDRELSGGSGDDDDGDDGDGRNNGEGRDLLRISVNDNGCGMKSIEGCVEAFRTSKRCDCGGGGLGATAGGSTTRTRGGDGGEDDPTREDAASRGELQEDENSIDDERQKKRDASDDDAGGGEQSLTAGRYGIGLTLCLLHSQRLCPRSASSITSATAASPHWTRASYVVDAESDRVKCVKKELLPKKRTDESGTVVSLLVPGGEEARRIWPRLAEYFARFQLSLGVRCSLEVKAPTLSSVPLYIRPPFEMERRKVLKEKERTMSSKAGATAAITDVNNNTKSASVRASGSRGPDQDWNDGMLSNDEIGDDDGDVDDISSEKSNEAEDHSIKGRQDRDDNAEPPSNAESDATEEEMRRRSILRAVTSYLNRPVELKNVAHSVQPIRRYGQTETNAPSSRPMLEVDIIVYGRDDDRRSDAGEEEDAESDNNSDGDEFENMFARGEGASTHDASVANLMLIRMVNRIPLLDGAEASGCGLVRGIATKESTWNSFGLDVSPAMETRAPALSYSLQGRRGDNIGPTCSDAPAAPEYTPTYSIRDSAQVAPFFRSNAHSLFESDDVSDDDDGEGSDEEDPESSEDEGNYPREKRKRKAKARALLPAGLRLGNVLIITQIHAKPAALPLPTLSKGRLPMNDAGIDDALEIGLTSCLRSLQRTNPELLLTAYQLKRTERDLRYIPAVSASLASIIKKSPDTGFQNHMVAKVVSWEKENAKAGSVPQPATEKILSQNIGQADIVETQLSREGREGSTQITTDCDEGSGPTVIKASQQVSPLSVAKLTQCIGDQLRFCISDQNKARRKKEEQEKKRNARRRRNGKDEEDEEEGSEEESGSELNNDEGSIDLDGILECTDDERSSCPVQARRCSQLSSALGVDESTGNDGSQRSEDEWSELQSPSSSVNRLQNNDSEEGRGGSGGQKLDDDKDNFDDDGWW